jgi:hypothetical protein
MSRTVKREWSHPDGWHTSHRIARKARTPQGDREAFYQDLAEEGGDDEPVPSFPVRLAACR